MGGAVKRSGTQECGKTELFVDDTTDFFHEIEEPCSITCGGNHGITRIFTRFLC
ncbi:MAG: hypothetical protein C5S47_02165 [Candidatus Methanogasteraceae archaeon]|nr:MAG: hypothetical protein C5S47_02165 [ANME-2 cluster archaeon]